jgi:EAL domain-containing protein (putative c-di-GMP-specific phosphodiesterase class I)
MSVDFEGALENRLAHSAAAHIPGDLMLIVDRDVASLQILCRIADRIGCDRIEAESPESLRDVLPVRRPTIAVVAIDQIEADGLQILELLVQHGARPFTLLIGAVDRRVLASATRAAERHGLTVIGASARPLDANQIENILSAHVAAQPPIAKQELENAMAEHEMLLQYEPKVAVGPDSLKVQGVQALVRWQHPQRGLLFPRHFLRAVEEHDLMLTLTDFVLTEAVRQAGQWRARDLSLQMAVKLSPRLIRDRAFPERLASLLHDHDLPAQQIVFDITEAPSKNVRNLILDVFTRLRILGVGLSLDNFGTGFSSLIDLYRLPFSEIKVDRSLLVDVTRDQDAKVIVRAIASLARTLGLTISAEGVETRDMLEFVRAVGFDSAQGPLFGSAMSGAEVAQLVIGWPRSAPAATGTSCALRTQPAEEAEIPRRLQSPKLRSCDG